MITMHTNYGGKNCNESESNGNTCSHVSIKLQNLNLLEVKKISINRDIGWLVKFYITMHQYAVAQEIQFIIMC